MAAHRVTRASSRLRWKYAERGDKQTANDLLSRTRLTPQPLRRLRGGPACGCAVRRDGRPGATEVDSRPGLSGHVRVGAQHRDRRHLARGHLHGGVPQTGQVGDRGLRHAQAQQGSVDAIRRDGHLRAAGRGPRCAGQGRRRRRGQAGAGSPSPALSFGATQGRARGDHHAAGGRLWWTGPGS